MFKQVVVVIRLLGLLLAPDGRSQNKKGVRFMGRSRKMLRNGMTMLRPSPATLLNAAQSALIHFVVKLPQCAHAAIACIENASRSGGPRRSGHGACPRAHFVAPSQRTRCATAKCKTML